MTTEDAEPERIDQQGMKSLETAVGTFLREFRAIAANTAYKSAFHDVSGSLAQLEASYNKARGKPRPVPRQSYESKRTQMHAGDIGERKVVERHESYGVIHISRVQGSSRRLFGSSVKHGHFFTMTISRAERHADSFGESFYETTRICEIYMSAAQFVDAMTTMNQGAGIPVTISRVEGVPMDPVPESAGSELKVVADNVGEGLRAVGKLFKDAEKELDGLLDKKALNKDDKQRIREAVYRARRLFDDSAPYAAKVMGEVTERMVAKGRAEVDSFLRLALEHAGIKSIRDSDGHLVLGTGEKEK